MTTQPDKIFADALLAAGWKQLSPDDAWREDRGHQAVYPHGLSRPFIRGLSDMREIELRPVRFFEAPDPVVRPVAGMLAWVVMKGQTERVAAFCVVSPFGDLVWNGPEGHLWLPDNIEPITEDDVIYRPEAGE